MVKRYFEQRLIVRPLRGREANRVSSEVIHGEVLAQENITCTIRKTKNYTVMRKDKGCRIRTNDPKRASRKVDIQTSE